MLGAGRPEVGPGRRGLRFARSSVRSTPADAGQPDIEPTSTLVDVGRPEVDLRYLKVRDLTVQWSTMVCVISASTPLFANLKVQSKARRAGSDASLERLDD